jgi:hypothetical protein
MGRHPENEQVRRPAVINTIFAAFGEKKHGI